MSEPPPDLDYTPDDDPWLPIDDRFVPGDAEPQFDMPPPGQDGLQGLETPEPTDEGWAWQDARLIGVERVDDAGIQYEIGCMDVYANLNTGDLGGSYLPIASFGDADVAAVYYHDLQDQMHREGVASHEVPAFAERAAAQIQGQTPGAWANEFEAYEQIRAAELGEAQRSDDVPTEAFDPLLEEALRLGGVVQEIETAAPAIDDPSAFRALSTIGIEAPDFDPAKDPPPFYDAETGTAYWIGVFQPDQADQEHYLTSILSLGRGEDGELQAQLAPCVPGDWDKAYTAAEYLIGVAEKGGIDRCFDADGTGDRPARPVGGRAGCATRTGGDTHHRRLCSSRMGGGTVSEGKSYTIRFTPEDYAILDALCQQFGLKRPDALRRVLRVAQAAQMPVTSGVFSPIGAQGVFQVKTGGANDTA